VPVIVDTYNVLHVTGVLHPERAGIDVAGLATLVAGSRFGSETVWLVCDGTAKGGLPRGPGRVSAVFAGPGRSADDHIGRMIEASTAPRRLTVVSSDLQIGRMARRRRCRWLRAEEFLARLDADAQVHPSAAPRRPAPARERGRVPLDAREVEQWMKHFGVDGTEAGVASAPRPSMEAPPMPTPQPGSQPQSHQRSKPQPGHPSRSAPTSREVEWAAVDWAAVMNEALAAVPPTGAPARRRDEHRRGGRRR